MAWPFTWQVSFVICRYSNLIFGYEWFYYTKTGFDPKAAAHMRWEISVRVEDKVPETEAEEIMPLKNRWVILRDKFMQSPDEVIFFRKSPKVNFQTK